MWQLAWLGAFVDAMRVKVTCGDAQLEINVGAGKQHIRWLALVVATRIQREQYPHAFRVPHRVQKADENMTDLDPRAVIKDELENGEEIIVELRQGPPVQEDTLDDEDRWYDRAYGPDSNLMDCKFLWKVDPKSSDDFPEQVRGVFSVSPKWQSIYPQEEYGGRFECQMIPPPQDHPDRTDWFAVKKFPPGTCVYRFVMPGGLEVPCLASPETLTSDGLGNRSEFIWDVPIVSEPDPEIDSRPSTASSKDVGVDPRFEKDWEAMQLNWVKDSMKVRVKDVFVEFYAILIDLFDSYAFMGPDVGTSDDTIGMDDWRHLIINCGIMQGQLGGSLLWSQVCLWYESAASTKDWKPSFPYHPQRLTRPHYLELLMRAAWWVCMEHPGEAYAPQLGRPPMPLDEALFRFITDILIPVMDVYDEDPIRKEAVIQQNLMIIQQHRNSIREMYSFLAQPWPPLDMERAVVPATLRFVFNFTKSRLESVSEEHKKEGIREEDNPQAIEEVSERDLSSIFGGDGCLTLDEVLGILASLDPAIAELTSKHPEPPEHRALFFWEFFEVLVECCRKTALTLGTQTHETIKSFVLTTLAFITVAESGEVTLPPVSPSE